MPHTVNPFKVWAAYSEAAMLAATTAMASATTIATRLTMLGTVGLATSPRAAQREAHRMVSEKIHATMESAVQTGKAAAKLSRRSTKGQDMALAPVTIGMAALQPYAKRAKRNARRLSSQQWKLPD